MRPPAHVIAEIGCNHKGNFDTAIQLINAAKDAGADVAKFQKRNVKESLREEIYNGPHPNPHNSYGNTYCFSKTHSPSTFSQHRLEYSNVSYPS